MFSVIFCVAYVTESTNKDHYASSSIFVVVQVFATLSLIGVVIIW